MIKNIFLILFSCICFFSTNIFAGNFEESFLKASDFYSNKKYDQALGLYNSIDCKSPLVIYNIGNCEYALGRYFEALICWNKAKKNATFSLLSAINHNISQAKLKLGGHKDETNWQNFVDDIVNLFSLLKLQIWFIFFWFIFFILYIYLKKLRFAFLIINMFFVFVFGSLVFVKYSLEKFPMAISKSCTGVFCGPNKNYHKIADISIAERVRVKKTYKDWCNIKYNGITGWVLASNLEII